MWLYRRTTLVAALALAIAPSLQAQTPAGVSGHWEGKIEMSPTQALPVTVDLTKNDAGQWIGSISIPVSTSIDVPIADIVVDARGVRFSAHLPDTASFDGTLSADAGRLAGTVSDARGGVPFELTRHGEADVKVPPPSSPLSKEFEGRWEGRAEVGGKAIRLGLELSAAADGTATGTLINLEQGTQYPITTVTIADRQLRVESRPVSGIFSGTLGANGEMAGEFAQKTTRFALTFRRAAAAKN
jgi:hypothetical protein